MTVRCALFGAGLMGSFHADTLALRLPNARLAVIADPVERTARQVIAGLGRTDVRYESDFERVLVDTEIDAVVIATPGRFHADLIVAAAQAGKPTFCEKPIAHEMDGAKRAAAAVSQAGTLFQIGFQRRFEDGFQQARRLVTEGALGNIHLVRSITRDPAVPRPEGALPWAIFLETLIHDFDVLRWLSASEPVEVQAMCDALTWPRGDRGMVDTAVVNVRFANGALGMADSSFQSAYGYDVRAEVFGDRGMATAGDGRIDSSWHFSSAGASRRHAPWFKDQFGAAYVAELAHFVNCVENGRVPDVSIQDGLGSLAIALAAIESTQSGRSIKVAV